MPLHKKTDIRKTLCTQTLNHIKKFCECCSSQWLHYSEESRDIHTRVARRVREKERRKRLHTVHTQVRFLIFWFNSNQDVHLDSLSLHSTGRQIDWHFRSKFVLRPFIGRPNCASDSTAGRNFAWVQVCAHTWAGSWYSRQRQVKSRQVHTRSRVCLSLPPFSLLSAICARHSLPIFLFYRYKLLVNWPSWTVTRTQQSP